MRNRRFVASQIDIPGSPKVFKPIAQIRITAIGLGTATQNRILHIGGRAQRPHYRTPTRASTTFHNQHITRQDLICGILTRQEPHLFQIIVRSPIIMNIGRAKISFSRVGGRQLATAKHFAKLNLIIEPSPANAPPLRHLADPGDAAVLHLPLGHGFTTPQ